MDQPLLSIVIPAFNEEKRLPATLECIERFLQTQPYAAEVIVVENGSQDRTFEIAQEFSARNPVFISIHELQRGKGLAVRTGMLAAKGTYRFICDADLSMPIEQVNQFIPPARTNFDIAIASREAPGAVRYDEPAYRHLVGRLFNTLVRWAILPGLQDTQCGFKCFRGDVADELFRLQTIPGWTFDVEVLYIAHRRKMRIIEVGIPWYFNSESKVNVFRDLKQVGRDLLTIWRNARKGAYDAPLRSR